MITCGIDIGSASTEALVLVDGKIGAMEMIETGPCPPEGASYVLELALKRAGLRRTEVDHLLATGIGREHLAGTDSIASEVTCHAAGVMKLIPDARTVIEIGGQDSKIIALEADGKVKDFMMNDRCAAGTGRFLEGVARSLKMSLDEIARAGLSEERPCEISAMCAVFAETEIIGLIHKGMSREAVLQGAFRSVARKVLGMAQRVGIRDVVVLTGGVGRNAGIAAALRALTGHEVVVPANPQYTGALGAAILAARRAGQKEFTPAGHGEHKEDHGRPTRQCCADSGR